MTISGWWERMGEEADRSLAARRDRFQERQQHPPPLMRFLGRHRWVGWLFGTAIIVADFAFGATLIAVVSLVGMMAVVLWARNHSNRRE